MDLFNIALWVFAGIGVILLGMLIITVVVVSKDRTPSPMHVIRTPYDEAEKENKIKYLNNEITGDMRREYGVAYGTKQLDEPTLKSRVDMIEKHLGIQVTVKPVQPAKIVIKKRG